MLGLPMRARLFVAAVCAGALLLILTALVHVARGSDHKDIVAIAALAALYMLSDAATARGARDHAALALSSVVMLSAIPLVGLWGSVLVPLPSLLLRPEREPLVKRAFNTAQLTVSAAVACLAFYAVGGHVGVTRGALPGLLWQVLLADVAHLVVNGLLVAGIVALHQGVRLRVVLFGQMADQAASYLGYGMFGLLLAVLWDGLQIGPFAALLVLIPLFVARWAYAQYAEQQNAYDRTIRALVQAVETKDLYTRGHSERVAKASVMIARRIGMREDRIGSLRYAGILHDVGKLGVPTRVLQKTGRLTEDEFEAIKLHPVRGLEVVREIEFLDEAYAGIMHHHERLDGRGYPMGLAGEQIPEFARVIAVADAFDSMTTTRSYRGARSVEDAIEELERCSGTQFDPQMVVAMIAALKAEGWEPETEPLFDLPEQQSRPVDSYDHDDPTVTLSPGDQESGR